MDIGQLENLYSYDKSGSEKSQTGTSGPLKIGDYDDKPNKTKEQTKEIIESSDNTIGGKKDNIESSNDTIVAPKDKNTE
ncbi:hypothetical protein G6F56_013580 [Rhizopus delemar]|nr:hypothetical protein G6F56_013580 [Rhizopus delemar]